MLTATIKTKVNEVLDKFWRGGITNPITAIEQISYLIFMKWLNETDTEKVPSRRGFHQRTL